MRFAHAKREVTYLTSDFHQRQNPTPDVLDLGDDGVNPATRSRAACAGSARRVAVAGHLVLIARKGAERTAEFLVGGGEEGEARIRVAVGDNLISMRGARFQRAVQDRDELGVREGDAGVAGAAAAGALQRHDAVEVAVTILIYTTLATVRTRLARSTPDNLLSPACSTSRCSSR